MAMLGESVVGIVPPVGINDMFPSPEECPIFKISYVENAMPPTFEPVILQLLYSMLQIINTTDQS